MLNTSSLGIESFSSSLDRLMLGWVRLGLVRLTNLLGFYWVSNGRVPFLVGSVFHLNRSAHINDLIKKKTNSPRKG